MLRKQQNPTEKKKFRGKYPKQPSSKSKCGSWSCGAGQSHEGEGVQQLDTFQGAKGKLQDCIRGGEKGKPTPGHGSLLGDSHRAPHGPTAVAGGTHRRSQRLSQCIPNPWEVSQAWTSVTENLGKQWSCPRPGSVSAWLTHCHIMRDRIICATSAGGTGQGLSQEAPTSPQPQQERCRASEEPSAEGMGWFTDSQRGKGGKSKENVTNSEGQRKRRSVCPVGRC